MGGSMSMSKWVLEVTIVASCAFFVVGATGVVFAMVKFVVVGE